MYRGLDPGDMTPEERAREVAAILAQGYLRLRENGPLPGDSAPKPEGVNHVTSNISNGCASGKSPS